MDLRSCIKIIQYIRTRIRNEYEETKTLCDKVINGLKHNNLNEELFNKFLISVFDIKRLDYIMTRLSNRMCICNNFIYTIKDLCYVIFFIMKHFNLHVNNEFILCKDFFEFSYHLRKDEEMCTELSMLITDECKIKILSKSLLQYYNSDDIIPKWYNLLPIVIESLFKGETFNEKIKIKLYDSYVGQKIITPSFEHLKFSCKWLRIEFTKHLISCGIKPNHECIEIIFKTQPNEMNECCDGSLPYCYKKEKCKMLNVMYKYLEPTQEEINEILEKKLNVRKYYDLDFFNKYLPRFIHHVGNYDYVYEPVALKKDEK
jgi:hypothetical protein